MARILPVRGMFVSAHWFDYRCPSCQGRLEFDAKGVVCALGHRFDRNKKGFIHLLLSHQMGSKAPGDSKMMVQARREFLDTGAYRPVVDAIARLCEQLGIGRLLDAGCGEGYYASSLAARGFQVAGVDISKEAVSAACRRDKTLDWSVASVAALPYMDESFDGVLSVFSRVDAEQFARVLRPGGVALYVGPGDDHLPQLRAGLYREVRAYKSDKSDRYFPGWERVDSHRVCFEFSLTGRESVENLLKMTPHYWATNPEQHARLLAREALTDRADMQIRVYRKPALAETLPEIDN